MLLTTTITPRPISGAESESETFEASVLAEGNQTALSRTQRAFSFRKLLDRAKVHIM